MIQERMKSTRKNIPLVAFDIRPLQTESRYRGVGILILNIVKYMLKKDLSFDILFVANAGIELPSFVVESKHRILYVKRNFMISKVDKKIVWIPEKAFLKNSLKKAGVDLYFCTIFAEPNYPILIPDDELRVISWIYDLTPFKFKDLFRESLSQKSIGYSFEKKMDDASKSNHILTLSETSADEIAEKMGIRRDSIDIIYPGIGFESVDNVVCERDFFARYPDLGRYIFYIGGFDERKNLKRVLSAFSLLVNDVRDINFVIGGNIREDDGQYINLKEHISELGIVDRVIFTGFIEERFLPCFYSHAKFLSFVTLDEGFGIPPIEAMFCKTPVLSSNVSCIPEVVGDAALLVDPYSIEDILSGMQKLLLRKDLVEQLIRNGTVRSKRFTWDRGVDAVIESIEKILYEHSD